MKTPPLVGVDISASFVKMVELAIASKRGKNFRLEGYSIEPLPAGAMQDGGIVNMDAVGSAIERGWKRMKTNVKNVALALPSAEVITKKIIVPAGQREEDLAFQVENEASQYIPFAMDEVNMDFQELGTLGTNSEEVEVLIAASRKDKVEDRVAAALSAGLKAMVVDVEPFAAQAAFEYVTTQLPGDNQDKVLALIDIGATKMSLNIFHKGESVYMRDQPYGGNQLTQDIQNQFELTVEEAEKAKRNGGLPENYETDILQPFCETLSIEAMRAIQFFFTSTQFTEIDNIFLAGGCAVIPGLSDTMASRTQTSTLTVNPFSSMEQSSRINPRQLNMDAPSLFIACGLAMRGFDSI